MRRSPAVPLHALLVIVRALRATAGLAGQHGEPCRLDGFVAVDAQRIDAGAAWRMALGHALRLRMERKIAVQLLARLRIVYHVAHATTFTPWRCNSRLISLAHADFTCACVFAAVFSAAVSSLAT